MTHEIERKFLVVNEGWRALAISSSCLRDGIVAYFAIGKMRVRLDGDHSLLTVKGLRTGIQRAEYEYEIPAAEAQEMLRTICDVHAV